VQGACHCGKVRFRVDWTIDALTTCNCSICRTRNALMAKVPERALRVLEGQDLLTLYTWNTGRAQHFFCKRCGIYLFHRKRAAPDHFGVNVYCLDGFDPSSVPVSATDGASMTLEGRDLNPDWPGPRIEPTPGYSSSCSSAL
jgi:hypothetical protein